MSIAVDAPAEDRRFHVGEAYGHSLTAVVERGHLYARVRTPADTVEYPLWNPTTAQMEQWETAPPPAALLALEAMWRALLAHPAFCRRGAA